MKFAVVAMGLSILCLFGSLVFALPIWINAVGIGLGVIGLILLERARKTDGT